MNGKLLTFQTRKSEPQPVVATDLFLNARYSTLPDDSKVLKGLIRALGIQALDALGVEHSPADWMESEEGIG